MMETLIRGLTHKMKNRRVSMWSIPDGSWIIDCKRLGAGRREIVKTRLKLSDEAMQAVSGIYIQFCGVEKGDWTLAALPGLNSVSILPSYRRGGATMRGTHL